MATQRSKSSSNGVHPDADRRRLRSTTTTPSSIRRRSPTGPMSSSTSRWSRSTRSTWRWRTSARRWRCWPRSASWCRSASAPTCAWARCELKIEGVEAQALLKARLDNVSAILERVLTTLDRNPKLLESVGKAVEDVGGGAGQHAREAGEAVEDVGEGAQAPSSRSARARARRPARSARAPGQAAQGAGQGACRARRESGRRRPGARERQGRRSYGWPEQATKSQHDEVSGRAGRALEQRPQRLPEDREVPLRPERGRPGHDGRARVPALRDGGTAATWARSRTCCSTCPWSRWTRSTSRWTTSTRTWR